MLQTLSSQVNESVLVFTDNDRCDQISHARVCGIHSMMGAYIHGLSPCNEFHGLWMNVLKVSYELHSCLQPAPLKEVARYKGQSQWCLVTMRSGEFLGCLFHKKMVSVLSKSLAKSTRLVSTSLFMVFQAEHKVS